MKTEQREQICATESGLPISDKIRLDCETRRYVSCEYADINFPIELQPDTHIDSVETKFFGNPSVNIEECARDKYCITVTQRVRIRLIVTVSVSAESGEGYVVLRADTESG